ncbi:uncharacterized protein RAG0_04607 [Rhynchosporium agropyri]|uniref:Uncharacterized protein n=1 Tax=Rhynchosporium agropyri TaxID=914238 RepID=A0A1E1K9H0_9HELO|nr:uncharacterized protein RAG0_04607 [Rhynchosporium agropyri]
MSKPQGVRMLAKAVQNNPPNDDKDFARNVLPMVVSLIITNTMRYKATIGKSPRDENSRMLNLQKFHIDGKYASRHWYESIMDLLITDFAIHNIGGSWRREGGFLGPESWKLIATLLDTTNSQQFESVTRRVLPAMRAAKQ